MDEGNPLTGLMVVFLILLLKAIVTCINVALYSVNDGSLKKESEEGNEKADKLLQILEFPEGYYNGMELIIDFSNIFIGVFWVMKMVSLVNIRPLLYVPLTILFIFASTLFTTTIPKKFGQKYANIICLKTIPILNAINFILKPFTWLLEKIMNLVFLIFRINPKDMEDNVTGEEIISIVNEGHEQGLLNYGEAEMISNIIELDEKEAGDIMTNKKNIVAVSSDMNIEEAMYLMLAGGFSRYPLYEENIDNVIGILHLKDIISAYISDDLKDASLKKVAREAYFVPDTQSINILFHEMQSNNIHMAVVIDEYGQTAGLVAMEDFIEEIVGNIQDEYDKEEELVISVDENGCLVRGSIDLEELEDQLHIDLEHDDFDTLNGLLISLLDRIPDDGEQAVLEYQGYRFEIIETLNRMIQKVRISKLDN